MKTGRTLSKKSAIIPKARWLAYATASATSALAVNSAEAAIHYSGSIDQAFNGCRGDTATFPLDQSGDFIRLRASVSFCFTDYGGGAYFAVGGLAGAAFAGRHNTCPYRTQFVLASRLHSGQLISARQFSSAQSAVLAIASHDFCDPKFGWIGRFDGKDAGFVGFKFNNGSGDQYGWARIKMAPGMNINQNFKLLDYAYGDVGDQVHAGQTSSDDTRTNKGSLGLIAIGAAGLLAWRRRRRERLDR